MGEKLVTTLGLLTMTAIIVRNGKDVSEIVKGLSTGARAVISVLVTGR